VDEQVDGLGQARRLPARLPGLTRAHLLVRLGRKAEAAAAYDQAIALAANETERAFLQTRRATLDPRPQ
jgi:RNA polymerase sigma-70 factor (ECF subfamily)